MTRRKRAAARLLLFGGSLVAGGAAWTALHDPLGGRGALASLALSELLVPGLFLFLLVAPSGIRESFPLRRTRIIRRKLARQAGLRRPSLRARLKRMLLRAYRGRCVACRSRVRIEYEHRRPYSRGGKTWFPNMTLLCHECNEIKLSYWVERDGWVADGWGRVNHAQAARILFRERLALANPFMWWRAAWAWF
jgi:5-methylcytosine-specific restriction endonuclease McrA